MMRIPALPEEEQLHYGTSSLTDSSVTVLLFRRQSIAGCWCSCTFVKPKCFFNESLIKERCGNSEVEDWEDCDCGFPSSVLTTHVVDLTLCLEVGVECPIGDCCTNCTWSKKGTLADQCRIYVIFQNTVMELSLYASEWSLYAGWNALVLKRVTANGICALTAVCTAEKFWRDSFRGHDDCYEINTGTNRFDTVNCYAQGLEI